MKTIDVSVGEAYLVQEAFKHHYKISTKLNKDLFQYQKPNGYKPLIYFLEAKYNKKIVITNGAKQGLYAALFAAKKFNKIDCNYANPYWFCIPEMIKHSELNPIETSDLLFKNLNNNSSLILVNPNNPNGWLLSKNQVKDIVDRCNSQKITLIHDAAYYSENYLPENYKIKIIGDMQIHSMSKSYGLSGFRLGYVICNNDKYYDALCEYQELTTVGVSTLSQNYLLEILKQDYLHKDNFIKEVRENLLKSKHIISEINPSILEIPDNFDRSIGMFLWAKKIKNINYEKLNIQIADGKLFGNEDYVRINLAINHKDLKEIVKRINSLK